MTKSSKANPITASAKADGIRTKHQKIIDLLSRDCGATLEEMATIANWLPHSTRAFMTGLKKKGHAIDSEKADGVRRYRITASPSA